MTPFGLQSYLLVGTTGARVPLVGSSHTEPQEVRLEV